LWLTFLAYVLQLVSMTAVLSFAILLSTMTNSSLTAAVGSLVIVLVVEILLQFSYFAFLRAYVFTTYFSSGADLFQRPVPWAPLCAASSARRPGWPASVWSHGGGSGAGTSSSEGSRLLFASPPTRSAYCGNHVRGRPIRTAMSSRREGRPIVGPVVSVPPAQTLKAATAALPSVGRHRPTTTAGHATRVATLQSPRRSADIPGMTLIRDNRRISPEW
jgi:hypothetical protein